MLKHIQLRFQVLCAFVLLTFAAGGVLAGSHGKPCDHGKHSKGSMLEQAVTLTEEQKTAYSAIRSKYKDEMKSLRKQQHKSHKALMELDPQDKAYNKKLKQLASENAKAAEQRTLVQGRKHAEVMALLTPEQKQSLKDYHAEMRAQKKEMHKHHKAHSEGMSES